MDRLPNIKYNGWTNYETWRVNIEFFDGTAEFYEDTVKERLYSNNDYKKGDKITKQIERDLSYFLADILRVDFDNYIDEHCQDVLLQGLLRTFVSDVNDYEIASHIVEQILESIR